MNIVNYFTLIKLNMWRVRSNQAKRKRKERRIKKKKKKGVEEQSQNLPPNTMCNDVAN